MSGKPIVVGVDGSPPSLRAAALAWRIAQAMGVEYHVVHAVRESRLSGEFALASPPVRGLLERALVEARKEIAARLRRVVPPGAVRTLEVRPGRAALVLAERAAHHGAGCVVLGGKPRGPLGRALGGSTAHHLVRTLDLPTLVAASSAIGRVLVAVDLSAAAAPTLEAGREWARRLGARLRVLHVVEPIRYPYVVPRAPDRRAFQRRSADAFIRLTSELGIAKSERAIRRGVAGTEIAGEVARWKADLLVVGSHGKGFADRLLTGSVTEWLLDRAPASVLVVPVAAVAARTRRARRA